MIKVNTSSRSFTKADNDVCAFTNTNHALDPLTNHRVAFKRADATLME